MRQFLLRFLYWHQAIIQLIFDKCMGSFRSQPDLKKHTQNKAGHGAITYAVSHMCGWRIYMEDAHISHSPIGSSKNSLFGVFDGHGGAEVAVFVERHFLKELENNNNYKNGKYQQALKQTFMRMDVLLQAEQGKKQICSIQKEQRQKDNGPKYDEESRAGCTANVVLVTPDTIYCANAGDSRAVACVNGQAVELSRDHKPLDPGELQRINKAGSSVSDGRVNGGLNLSRALGDLQYKRAANIKPEDQAITAMPDVMKIKNEGLDFIIMGCDGIWQVKTNNEMVDWVKRRLAKQTVPNAIVQQLLDELVSKDSGNLYGMDNMSTILVKFKK